MIRVNQSLPIFDEKARLINLIHQVVDHLRSKPIASELHDFLKWLDKGVDLRVAYARLSA